MPCDLANSRRELTFAKREYPLFIEASNAC